MYFHFYLVLSYDVCEQCTSKQFAHLLNIILMRTKVFKSFLSLVALGAIIWLAFYEAKTGQDISQIVYWMLWGVTIGMSSEELKELLSIFKR